MHHDVPTAGHSGRERTLELISRCYWWPSMRADVEAYVSKCDKCQRHKTNPGKIPGSLTPLYIPDYPWQSMGVDFMVSLPMTKSKKNSICVFVCRLTKQVHLCATTNKVDGKETADMFLDKVLRLHGVPRDIVSDRGPQFAGSFWQGLTRALGATPTLSTAYHPQTDGQTERANRVVADTLRLYCDQAQDDWDEHLPLVEFALNNSVSAATGQSPFYMLYGYHPNLLATIDVPKTRNPQAASVAQQLGARLKRAKECIQAAQDRMKRQYDSGHKPQTFVEGDSVLLSTKNIRPSGPAKLTPRFIGPYQVSRKVGSQAYELALPPSMRIHNVFHTSLLKPYRSDGAYQPPPVDWLGDEPFWAVERILRHATVTGTRGKPLTKYLVLWKGYSEGDATWEPRSQFSEDSLIQAYWDSLGVPMPKS